MKLSRIKLAALTLLAAMFVAIGIRAGDETQSAVESLGVVAASEFVAQHNDAVIMDVRTPAEFDLSHISGAINANVQSDDFESLLAGPDKSKTYLVHCTRNPENGRSSCALETMQRLGFNKLYSLDGGYVAWQDAELPLTEAEN